ncbi:hypothetical protein [Paraburkholderia sp. DGU8]|uniref:hypothetical protein n=1 Tax=Paraburkholderia sp. DGU8 TaxID=3161997 RepID=UPI003467DF61
MNSTERESLLRQTGELRLTLNAGLREGRPITDLLPAYKRLIGQIEAIDKAEATQRRQPAHM